MYCMPLRGSMQVQQPAISPDKRQIPLQLTLTDRMFNLYYSTDNRPKTLLKDTGSLNKQNIDVKNQATKCCPSSKVRLQHLEILKQSAIAALIEKEEIIQSMRQCNHDDLLVEIEQLTGRVKQLQLQNDELKAALEETVESLHQERQEWNQQHYKLVEQIDYLKETLANMEASAEQVMQKNGQLMNQNELIWQEMNNMQTVYKAAKEQLEQNGKQTQRIASPQNKLQQNQRQYQTLQEGTRLQIHGYSYQKLIFDDKSPLEMEQNIDQNVKEQCLSNFRQILSYETEDWLEQQSIQHSVRQQHCLGRSLKAINLIDNYSVNSKNNANSDNQSQFTYRYFRYPNENHLAALDKVLQDSCEHIPQQPEEEVVASQHQTIKQSQNDTSTSVWWERLLLLASGVCTGAYLAWKWKI